MKYGNLWFIFLSTWVLNLPQIAACKRKVFILIIASIQTQDERNVDILIMNFLHQLREINLYFFLDANYVCFYVVVTLALILFILRRLLITDLSDIAYLCMQRFFKFIRFWLLWVKDLESWQTLHKKQHYFYQIYAYNVLLGSWFQLQLPTRSTIIAPKCDSHQ